MTKQDEYAKALERRAEKFNKNDRRDFSSLLDENFSNDQHIMLIEEQKFFSSNNYKKIVEENFVFEKVDLIDFWNVCENGRTNKKR